MLTCIWYCESTGMTEADMLCDAKQRRVKRRHSGQWKSPKVQTLLERYEWQRDQKSTREHLTTSEGLGKLSANGQEKKPEHQKETHTEKHQDDDGSQYI